MANEMTDDQNDLAHPQSELCLDLNEPAEKQSKTFNNRRTGPGRGGARPGAGRPKGSINKTTAELRKAAQQHTEAALNALVAILETGESETARIAAAREILDRGYGKSSQPIENADDKPFKQEVRNVTAAQQQFIDLCRGYAERAGEE